jgi:transcriptional regulator with XRE-family HTH domain
MTGAQMKRERMDRGKSIRGLARELNIPEQTIRRIEAGLGIDLERAKILADYYGVRVTDFPYFAAQVAA